MPLAAAIEEIEVRHHPPEAGRSNYGRSRVLKVHAHHITISLLTRFRESPTRGFALLGAPFLLGSLGTAVLAVGFWGQSIVLPTVSLLLGLVFVSCLFAGLLGEAILRTAGAPPTARRLLREGREVAA
jgi:hypothetical protein